MKVSVVSTNYNQKDSLKKLYDSVVANKEYLDLWVLWDDNSTDGSVEMIKGWEAEGKIPMKVHYGDKKSGMGERQNWIIKQSKDLFILVFGDSYLEPNGLKKLSETYIDGTAGSGYRLDITKDGQLVRNDYRFDPNDNVECVMQHRRPWQSLCGNGFICRRKYMEDIGWFDAEYKGYGHDDYDWFMRLMMNGVKLYAYNNIKIYHHDHPTSEQDPFSRERYHGKMEGTGYFSKAKTVSLDFHDFSVENNNLYYLDQLKRMYPKLKVSMFYVPFDAAYFDRLLDFQRQEAIGEIKKRLDWIELIPHGVSHGDQEFLNLINDRPEDYDIIFRGIEEAFKTYDLPMVKGFCAPQWLYKPSLVEYLDSKGWWMAVDRNQPLSLRTKKFYEYSHSIDEPFWLSNQDNLRLHGHISKPSLNDLPSNIFNIMKVNPEAEWKFVSENI